MIGKYLRSWQFVSRHHRSRSYINLDTGYGFPLAKIENVPSTKSGRGYVALLGGRKREWSSSELWWAAPLGADKLGFPSPRKPQTTYEHVLNTQIARHTTHMKRQGEDTFDLSIPEYTLEHTLKYFQEICAACLDIAAVFTETAALSKCHVTSNCSLQLKRLPNKRKPKSRRSREINEAHLDLLKETYVTVVRIIVQFIRERTPQGD